MKKIISYSLLFLVVGTALHAADVALIYENEAAVRAGKTVVGSITNEGVIVSAKMVLANMTTLMVGLPNDKLKKAVLLRLDNSLDMALVQAGELVTDESLQKLYQDKTISLNAFLPAMGASSGDSTSPLIASPTSTKELFLVKINGDLVGSEPIELLVKREMSAINLEIVQPSTTSVWHVDLKLTAEPKLSFWKKNQPKDLTDVPRPSFTYSYQAMFRPFAIGRSFRVPIDVYFVKEGAYTFLLKIESKAGNLEKRIPVVFKSK